MYKDESKEFWLEYNHSDLAQRCASLHAERRQNAESVGEKEIYLVRRTIAEIFIKGTGLELGAGSRSFPLSKSVNCFYGDVRDEQQLMTYFKSDKVALSGQVDAQTLDGIAYDSLDFIIQAHVIEHLFDPIGSIRECIKRLKNNGILLIAVPEMTMTWDKRRPITTLQHLIDDEIDAGEATKKQAFIEHCKYVHPELTNEHFNEDQINFRAESAMIRKMDIHVHAWTFDAFNELMRFIADKYHCSIEASIAVVNENIFVLKRI